MKTLNKNEMRKVEGGWLLWRGKKNGVQTYWRCGNCGYKTSSYVAYDWHMLWNGHFQTQVVDENGRFY